ncbi:MAG TPA: MBL fold metallo-hydrolase [Anaerolineales bacterium]|nr:MBL fold metallo-hydrolase [Anaerolineales bacterium]
MELYSVPSNVYKLDGGAMFGNAARALWERWMPPDARNRIRMATRPLLAKTKDATVLFEAGIGAYLEPRLRERFGVDEPGHMLLQSLAAHGVAHEQVTHVFLTHLHFDHAGGLLSAWQEGREPDLLFPNAQFYVSELAWERAMHPHIRDRASFIPRLNGLLEESGRLTLIGPEDTFSFDELEFGFYPSEGHSPGLLCFDLHYGGERLVYVSDLIPGRAWVHLPISMGYDRFPELLIDEKTRLLEAVEKEKAWIYYVHDPETALSRIEYDKENKTYKAVDPRPELRLGPH